MTVSRARRPRTARAVDSAGAGTAIEAGPVAARSRPADLVYDDQPVYHAVGKCRWCGGRFQRVFGWQWVCEAPACAQRQVDHAIRKTEILPNATPFFFLPLPIQVDMEEHPAKRLLVHGVAGFSKSYGARMHLYARCRKIPGYRALLLRCTYDQLKKNHLQYIPDEVKALGDAKWTAGNENRVRFDSGSEIFMGYCEHESHIPQHKGPEWDEVVIDEAVDVLPKAINEITARDRGSAPSRETRAKLGITSGRSRLLTNPGGRAMLFLDEHYIKRNPDLAEYPHYDPQYYGDIWGGIRDNPYLPEDYAAATLGGLDAVRYEQLAAGRWDVFPGQFFREWDAARHVQDRDADLNHAPLIGVVIWGYNRPGYVLWARILAGGRVYLVSEWRFSGKPIPEVAREIRAQLQHTFPRLRPRMLCPEDLAPKPMSPDDPLPRPAADAPASVFARYGVPLQAIDPGETHGWQRVHDYLREAHDGQPWLVVSPRCAHLIRTLPTLMSGSDPDDLAPDQDDRAALALRVLVASRPAPGGVFEPRKTPAYGTLGWWKAREDAATHGILEVRPYGR